VEVSANGPGVGGKSGAVSDAARPARFAPEELLAHADWARELAAHLVRDAAAAEDLAQDALVVAIEKPPYADRPLRPWLAAVLRKLALARRRGDGRRSRREEAAGSAAAARPAPSLSEVVARLDAHRVLAEAVAALPEPLRATVYLRYYEGLDSPEIARRHGVAPETVRWRLAMALAELRVRLDARSPGGRGEWLAALAPIAALRPAAPAFPRPSQAAPVAAALTGVLALATTTKLILGGAAAVIAAAALFWSLGDEGGSAGRPTRAAAMPAVAESPTAPRADRPDAPTKAPRRRGADETTAAASDAGEAPRAGGASGAVRERARVLEVRAHVLDPSGAAAAGARVECGTGDTPPGADGDAEGRVSFHIDADADADSVSFDFVVSAARCATRIVPGAPPREGGVLDLGDVRLGAGGAVEGRVVDTAGAGVPGASVAVASTDADGDTLVDVAPVAAADAEGRFVLRGVPSGRPSVYASAPGFEPKGAAVDVRPGEQCHGVVIALARVDPTARVRGVVQTPGGEAVPRAVITYRAEGQRSTSSGTITADAQGRFDIEGGRDKEWRISARDAEGRWSPSATAEARSGADSVVLRLTETRWAEVRVMRSDGAPAARYAVELRSADGLVIGRMQAEDHADGVARFKLPAQAFVLAVTAPGCADSTAGPLDPSKVASRIEVRATTLPGLRGRVTFGGAPVAGARVTLGGVVPAGTRDIRDGFPCVTSPTLDGAAVVTAADGTFDFTLRTAGRFVLRAEAPDLAVAEAGPFDLVPETGRQGIAIALTKGGAIEGRVLVADGRRTDGVIVGASRGDGEARTVRTGEGGAFRFERLTPGQWMVRQTDRELRPGTSTVMMTMGEAHFDWSCRVDEGATTHFDVDLRTESGIAVRGEVRVDGAPAAGWKVTLLAGASLFTAEETAPVTVLESGAYRVLAPRAGDYLVCATSPQGLHVYSPVKVADAEVTLALDFALGQVSVKGAAPGDPLALFWEGAGGRLALAESGTGTDGTSSAAPFPAGRVRLVRPSGTDPGPDPRKWTTVAEGDLAAGGSLVLDAAAK
jgi:RNA polymerase sigma factor (sigma-70 family)